MNVLGPQRHNSNLKGAGLRDVHTRPGTAGHRDRANRGRSGLHDSRHGGTAATPSLPRSDPSAIRDEVQSGPSITRFAASGRAFGLYIPPGKGTPMQGFKDFIFRGNLIELAVAFIIGGAFATVVTAFTKIIIELLAKVFGAPNFDGWAPGGLTSVGPFLTALVAFVILAAVVYFGLVKPYEAFSARRKKPTVETPIVPTTEDLLVEIRDLLAAQKPA